jgi:pimeloyl-ACP methyl ester carboxylesterase
LGKSWRAAPQEIENKDPKGLEKTFRVWVVEAKERKEKMKSQIAQTTKGPVEYTLIGRGPVVLVCHGTSQNCFSTNESAPLVEAGFSVLTPSRPGYGRTPLSVGRTAAQAAEALVALLDSLGIETCSVVALSGGEPTGVALAAGFPQRVKRLVLAEALARPEDLPNEPAYKSQVAFYGPMYSVFWGMLRIASDISPRNTARQTLAIFSTHDPEDALSRLSPEEVMKFSSFFHGQSSRKGALTDLCHTVGKDRLQEITQPTLIIHSREDKDVPFSHAEWALENIPRAELCEAGFTGHFFCVGPDFLRISHRMVAFLQEKSVEWVN